MTIPINLFTQFRILTSNINGQLKNTERRKFVVATYMKEYLLINEFINIDNYLKTNTDVHLEDLIGVNMIVVRELNNNKKLFQMI